MTKQETLTKIKEKLGAKIIGYYEKSPRRVYIEVKPEDIVKTTSVLFHDLQGRFQIASGVDTPTAIEILYHWAFDSLNLLISARTKLNRESPEIESISSICTGAEWIEREMWELLGIDFKNHPDLRHLLLTNDWPEGKYPLRRDYTK